MAVIGTGLGGTTSSLGGGTDGAGAEFTLAQSTLNPDQLWNASPTGKPTTNGQRVETTPPVQTISAPGTAGASQYTQLNVRELTRHPAVLADLVGRLRDGGALNQDGITPATTSGNLVYVLPTTGDGAKALGQVLATTFANRPAGQVETQDLERFLKSYPEVGAAYRDTMRTIGAQGMADAFRILSAFLLQVPHALRVSLAPAPSLNPALKPGKPDSPDGPTIEMVRVGDRIVPKNPVNPTQTGGALATRPNGQTLTKPATGTQPTNSGQRLLPPGSGTGQQPVGPLPSWGGGPAGSSGTTPIPAGRPSNTTPAVLTLETPKGEPFRVTVVKDKATNTFSVEVPQFRDGTGDITISSVRMKDGSPPPTFTAANQRVSEMLKAGDLAFPRAPAGGRTGGSGTSTGTPSGTGFNPNAPFGTASSGATTGVPGNFGGSSWPPFPRETSGSSRISACRAMAPSCSRSIRTDPSSCGTTAKSTPISRRASRSSPRWAARTMLPRAYASTARPIR